MSDASLVCNFNTNPDIAGIGVRVSFYLQAFCIVWIAAFRPKDAVDVMLTSIYTCLGLTIAGLIAAATNELSLYQAIQITYLESPMSFATYFGILLYSMTEDMHESILILSLSGVQAFISTAISLAMWVRAATFGNQPECNDSLTAVFFYISTSVSTARIVNIVFLSIGVAGLAPYVFIGSMALLGAKQGESPPKNDDLGPVEAVTSVKLVFLLIPTISIASYVGSLELMIRNNESPGSDNQTWGFGQVLAMLVTVPTIISFIRAISVPIKLLICTPHVHTPNNPDSIDIVDPNP